MKLFSRSKSQGPRTATITGTTKVFEVPGKDSILNEALAAGIPFPHSCTVGTCGTCKSKLVHGRVREIVDSAIALTAQELRDGYILPCQSIARTSIELDVAGLADMPEHPLVHTRAVISSHRALTHDIAEITLKLEQDLEYTAGQYAELRMDGLTGPRSYSFATAPTDTDRRRAIFYVRHVPGGQFSDWLFETNRDGTHLELAGPFGDLWLRPAEQPLLCVAGGSGLAPIKALLRRRRPPGVWASHDPAVRGTDTARPVLPGGNRGPAPQLERPVRLQRRPVGRATGIDLDRCPWIGHRRPAPATHPAPTRQPHLHLRPAGDDRRPRTRYRRDPHRHTTFLRRPVHHPLSRGRANAVTRPDRRTTPTGRSTVGHHHQQRGTR